MSHRTIKVDPLRERQKGYAGLESSGEAQRALWKAVEYLKENGIDIGPDAEAVLAQRDVIKKNAPK